jgi:hypothetical protein
MPPALWGRLSTCGPIVNRSIRAQPGLSEAREKSIPTGRAATAGSALPPPHLRVKSEPLYRAATTGSGAHLPNPDCPGGDTLTPPIKPEPPPC